MTTSLVAILTAVLPLTVAQFSGRTSQGVPWRSALGLGVVLLAGGMLLMVDSPGEYPPTFFAEATGPDRVALESTLVSDGVDGRRSFWRFVLKTPVKSGYELVLTLGILGLIATVLTLRLGASSEQGGRDNARISPMLLGAWASMAVMAGLTYWVFSAQPTGQTGPEGVRAALAHFEVGQLTGFTTPEGSWSYASDRMLVLSIMMGLAVLGLVQPWLPTLSQGVRDTAAVLGAVGAAFVCVWQMFTVGGLPWRGVEGGLWLAALCLVFAVLQRGSSLRSAALTVLALAVTSLAA